MDYKHYITISKNDQTLLTNYDYDSHPRENISYGINVLDDSLSNELITIFIRSSENYISHVFSNMPFDDINFKFSSFREIVASNDHISEQADETYDVATFNPKIGLELVFSENNVIEYVPIYMYDGQINIKLFELDNFDGYRIGPKKWLYEVCTNKIYAVEP